ncbi:hypothetical protein [Serratia fonticola]|uniref:hypothetical protein n=1 Tax=Serratia fonticola TaxID=47917 RepID=UPI00192CD30B|nr:hypothetical protein [Serratia fonticola]MBL5906244.1 hypothetical protein [Serratia fonticola]
MANKRRNSRSTSIFLKLCFIFITTTFLFILQADTACELAAIGPLILREKKMLRLLIVTGLVWMPMVMG